MLLGADDVLLSPRESRRLRVILPGKDQFSHFFANETSLTRHSLVNAALKTEIAAIHAWTQKRFPPEEWEKRIQAESAACSEGQKNGES